jgi:hypothetical protein
MLVSILSANRSEETEVDYDLAKQDALDLYEAGEKTLGTDESVYNRIMCTRSYPHLSAVFVEFKTLADKTIEESIESEMSGDLKRGMLALGELKWIFKIEKHVILYHCSYRSLQYSSVLCWCALRFNGGFGNK